MSIAAASAMIAMTADVVEAKGFVNLAHREPLGWYRIPGVKNGECLPSVNDCPRIAIDHPFGLAASARNGWLGSGGSAGGFAHDSASWG
jgi:hypothetical protein